VRDAFGPNSQSTFYYFGGDLDLINAIIVSHGLRSLWFWIAPNWHGQLRELLHAMQGTWA
jgi:hypothetical protein